MRPDDRLAPSFLLESVEDGSRQGRYSYLASQPVVEIIAHGQDVQRIDRRGNTDTPDTQAFHCDDPLQEMDKLTAGYVLAPVEGLPDFTGGWVGFAGYDTVRYLEGEKLPEPPTDDRQLPDMHMGLYRQVVAFR